MLARTGDLLVCLGAPTGAIVRVARVLLTLPQIAELAGVEYRTLHTWVKRGLFAPSVQASSGTGTPNLFAEEDAVRARILADLRRAGISLEVLALAGDRLGEQPEALRRAAIMLVSGDGLRVIFDPAEALGSLERGGVTLAYNTADAVRLVHDRQPAFIE